MFRKKPIEVECSSKALKRLIDDNGLNSISISNEVSFQYKRKEYIVVEMLINQPVCTDEEPYIRYKIQGDVKKADNIIIIRTKFVLSEVNVVGLLFKVEVDQVDCKLRIRLYLNK